MCGKGGLEEEQAKVEPSEVEFLPLLSEEEGRRRRREEEEEAFAMATAASPIFPVDDERDEGGETHHWFPPAGVAPDDFVAASPPATRVTIWNIYGCKRVVILQAVIQSFASLDAGSPLQGPPPGAHKASFLRHHSTISSSFTARRSTS